MRILYENLIDALSSASIIASSADASFPATWVQDERLAKAWRTTSASGQTIVFDLGSAHDIDSVAVIEHNVSSSATITLEGNSSNSWPGATSQSVTYNAGMMMKFFTASSYRYWRVSIDDPTNTDGYISVGRIWLGEYLTVDPSSLIGMKVYKHNSSEVEHGRGRQKYAVDGVTWREFELRFPPTQYAMVKSIEDFVDYVQNAHSFIFCNFDSDRTYQIVEPCYCSLNGNLLLVQGEYMKFEYSLTFEEEK